ncbi:MAG: hypothetical protein IPI26_09855 [Elusimicrobia bacterium]|nr:hypothetical protein [Elusimicrobiota bacterium]MBK7575535.1 hypothetical protein [Elusimicrobiota bacterium]
MNFIRKGRALIFRAPFTFPSWADRLGIGDGWRALNALLVLLLGVLAVGWMVTLWGPPGKSSEESAPFAGAGEWASANISPPAPTARRNIFASVYAPPAAKPAPATPPIPAAPPPPKMTISERVGHWRLVGVLPGPPVQAIIEDLRAQRTYDVTAGQTVEGVTIGEIREGSVLLLVEEERFELSL